MAWMLLQLNFCGRVVKFIFGLMPLGFFFGAAGPPLGFKKWRSKGFFGGFTFFF